MEAQQLLLNLPQPTSYDPAVFMVTPSNQEAYHWLTHPQQWRSYGLVLQGPKGCGKTHLACIWQQQTQGHFVSIADLKGNGCSVVRQHGAFILDDIETFTEDQESLFHLLNRVCEEQKRFLLTTSVSLDESLLSLKDLLSRLRALPMVKIHLPDDELFKAVMRKRFADLQMNIDERLINYILIHIERSFTALHDFIQQIYQECLKHKQRPTLSMVRKLLYHPGLSEPFVNLG
jgi:chromosomal replication initiation ATPase DnaA